MKKLFIVYWILFIVLSQTTYSQNAPVTTAGIVVGSGTTAVVPITVKNFINISSFSWQLNYNPAIATATLVTKSPLLGGSYDAYIASPGIISIGWYILTSDTVPDNTVIFNITFTKVANGTTALTWYDDGYSCYYAGPSGLLNDTPTSTYYINGSLSFGVIPLVADFTTSNITPAKNTTVQFSDLTTGGPTSWAWSFSRPTYVNFVNGTTAASQNPQVQFTDGGLYTVTLVATNASGSNTMVKTDYIRAGTAGLWAGGSSTEWATTNNWDNWLVPVSSVDVVIPSTGPAFWPVYTGDFTLGTECKSITMHGTSLATVTGNFVINPGASLNIVNNATFKVGGNWTNAGNFSAGTGTVEFINDSPASIISGGSPPVVNTFFNLTISKSTETLTILPDITVNGNLLINP
jgi:PKD repeat protein